MIWLVRENLDPNDYNSRPSLAKSNISFFIQRALERIKNCTCDSWQESSPINEVFTIEPSIKPNERLRHRVSVSLRA